MEDVWAVEGDAGAVVIGGEVVGEVLEGVGGRLGGFGVGV